MLMNLEQRKELTEIKNSLQHIPSKTHSVQFTCP